MLKITELAYHLTLEEDYKHISNFYIRNCLGNLIYFHTRDRAAAQEACDDMFSKGHYKVNAAKMSKPPESQSAVGRLNARSRMNSKGPSR